MPHVILSLCGDLAPCLFTKHSHHPRYTHRNTVVGFQGSKNSICHSVEKCISSENGLRSHFQDMILAGIRGRFKDIQLCNFTQDISLSSAGKHLSNTNLSDLSIVGTRDIFVYR